MCLMMSARTVLISRFLAKESYKMWERVANKVREKDNHWIPNAKMCFDLCSLLCLTHCKVSAGELHPDLSAVDVILKPQSNFDWQSGTFWLKEQSPVSNSRYLRTADFGDDLPGFIQDRQPLRFWRVGTGQTATQRSEQQMLVRRSQSNFQSDFKQIHHNRSQG